MPGDAATGQREADRVVQGVVARDVHANWKQKHGELQEVVCHFCVAHAVYTQGIFIFIFQFP
jgi:hypothetical protein